MENAPPETPAHELFDRIKRFREAMIEAQTDILIVTSRANFEYLTDHRTLSWAYQARPCFAVVTLGELIVVASRAEARNIARAERHFRTEVYDGFQAEAALAVVQAVTAADPGATAKVAIDYGQDIMGRGSLELVDGLRGRGPKAQLVSAESIVWRVRSIKSRFEAELKRRSFAIVNAAFDHVIAQARVGVTERALQRQLQAQIILNGAERADPIGMLFSRGDFVYSRPPSDRPLEPGHYLWTDFRSTFGGYPADRNRIARCGEPESWEIATYTSVRDVTIALCRTIRPGQTGGDIHRTFERLWSDAALPPIYAAASRIGHGGGLEVTEPPSVAAWSEEPISAGMILHLEPKLERDGAVFQFEEVVFVREDGIEFLSELSPECCPVIPAGQP